MVGTWNTCLAVSSHVTNSYPSSMRKMGQLVVTQLLTHCELRYVVETRQSLVYGGENSPGCGVETTPRCRVETSPRCEIETSSGYGLETRLKFIMY